MYIYVAVYNNLIFCEENHEKYTATVHLNISLIILRQNKNHREYTSLL